MAYSPRELDVDGEDILWQALKKQSFTFMLSSLSCQQFHCDCLLIDIKALNSWRHYVLTNEFRIYACSVLFQISCQNDSSIARGPFTQCIEQSQPKLTAIVTELNKWRGDN